MSRSILSLAPGLDIGQAGPRFGYPITIQD